MEQPFFMKNYLKHFMMTATPEHDLLTGAGLFEQ